MKDSIDVDGVKAAVFVIGIVGSLVDTGGSLIIAALETMK